MLRCGECGRTLWVLRRKVPYGNGVICVQCARQKEDPHASKRITPETPALSLSLVLWAFPEWRGGLQRLVETAAAAAQGDLESAGQIQKQGIAGVQVQPRRPLFRTSRPR